MIALWLSGCAGCSAGQPYRWQANRILTMKAHKGTLSVKSILIIFILSLLFSCATPYQKRGQTGGYEDKYMGNNKWQILVSGNEYTSVGRMEEYFHRHAKEITQENGCDGYIVEKFKTYEYRSTWGMRPRAEGQILCYKGQHRGPSPAD